MPKLSPRVSWTPELPHPIRTWLDRFECDWHFRRSVARPVRNDSWRWLTDQHVMPTGALEAGWSYLLGLWEHSHEISQDLPDAQGAFWHGCLHRQEGDHGNASYWFRRVQGSGLLEALAGVMVTSKSADADGGFAGLLTTSGKYDPSKLWSFATARDSGSADDFLWMEWQGAMSWFWREANSDCP